MTSRVSFLKLLLETLRRHLTAVLIIVLAFFVHVISFFINAQNIMNTKIMEDMIDSYLPARRGAEYAIEAFTELCSPNVWNAILAGAIGVYLAYDFFRYLHSKKETDFYESMPIRKQTRFSLLFIASSSVFLILATIALVLEYTIVCGFGYGSALITQNMFWNLISMIGIFLACFTTTVLTMIMTGHTIVAFLGFGVLVSYMPLIISNLVPLYAEKFFDTYVHHDISDKYYYFSPITLAYKASYSYSYNGNIWNIKNHWSYILGSFIFALVIGFMAYLLFLRRPSETAGRAMAFEKCNPIIRLLIVIPLSLYAGLLLNEIAAYDKNGWFIFGIVFAGFLLHGIIECIFQFDIKALLTKKKQLLFAILFCLGFVCIFWVDVFKYDEYMPKANDLKSVAIDTYLFDEGKYNWEEHKDYLTGDSIELALDAIKDIRKSERVSDDHDYTYTNDFTVTYILKNGVKKERQYVYYGDKFPETLDKLSATEDFKNDYCILYHTDVIDIASISVNNAAETFKLDMTDEEKEELYDIYLKEYSELTFTESLTKPAILSLIIEYPYEDRDYNISESYKIYSDFEETISYLSTFDVRSFTESEDILLVNLQIHEDKYGNNENIEQKYVSNKEQLNALKPHMVLCDFMNFHMNYGSDYLTCTLRYSVNGDTRYIDVYIKEADLKQVLNK